tara:strand:+ start:515 stop:853 length:339 start_codon:yes stop_codon:yes gene_type:complete
MIEVWGVIINYTMSDTKNEKPDILEHVTALEDFLLEKYSDKEVTMKNIIGLSIDCSISNLRRGHEFNRELHRFVTYEQDKQKKYKAIWTNIIKGLFFFFSVIITAVATRYLG